MYKRTYKTALVNSVTEGTLQPRGLQTAVVLPSCAYTRNHIRHVCNARNALGVA